MLILRSVCWQPPLTAAVNCNEAGTDYCWQLPSTSKQRHHVQNGENMCEPEMTMGTSKGPGLHAKMKVGHVRRLRQPCRGRTVHGETLSRGETHQIMTAGTHCSRMMEESYVVTSVTHLQE